MIHSLTLCLLFLFCFAGVLYAQEEATQFPQLKAETLNREKIVFPDDLTADINILILVFEQQAQRVVDTWAGMILKEFEPQSHISYYEIPMISTLYKPIAWQVDNWMRDGIPEDFHDNTATFYGNRKPYFKGLQMDKKDSCYLFIVDKAGKIRFRLEGPKTIEKEKAFRNALSTLQQSESS